MRITFREQVGKAAPVVPESRVTAGERLTLTEGSYSDYCILATVVVLRDADLAVLLSAYLDQAPEVWPEQTREQRYNSDDFIAFVAAQGVWEDAAGHRELYLGDFDPPNWKVTP